MTNEPHVTETDLGNPFDLAVRFAVAAAREAGTPDDVIAANLRAVVYQLDPAPAPQPLGEILPEGDAPAPAKPKRSRTKATPPEDSAQPQA